MHDNLSCGAPARSSKERSSWCATQTVRRMRFGTSAERATTALCFCLARPHVASGFGVRGLASRCSTTAATSFLANSPKMSAGTGAEAAAAVAILPAKAPLPLLDDGITVLSFNVLLPNGNDGWWMYKVRLSAPEDEMHYTGRCSRLCVCPRDCQRPQASATFPDFCVSNPEKRSVYGAYQREESHVAGC